MRPSQLLDPADRQRLETACFEADKRTRGTIALVVVRASDAYADAGWRLGLLLALAASLALGAFLPAPGLAELLAAQAVSLAAGRGLARSDVVRRRLLSGSSVEASVERRAVRAFAEAGLHLHPERAGVLIFVSLLEHRVLVLADTGVEEQAPGSDSWQQLVEPVVAGMRDGSAAGGLVEAIERCGSLLSRHFPDTGAGHAMRTGLMLED